MSAPVKHRGIACGPVVLGVLVVSSLAFGVFGMLLVLWPWPTVIGAVATAVAAAGLLSVREPAQVGGDVVSASRKRNQITWVGAPEPDRRRRPRAAGRAVCQACLVGDCDRCVRNGCYHPHGPEIRKVGMTVPPLRTLRHETGDET